MPVNPSYFAPADIVGAYQRGLQVRQQQQEAHGRKRLGDLLPQAVGMGGMDESGATAGGREAAMREIAQIDPRLFMQLDERQKAQAAAELDELAYDVRWADNPEKWAQVQSKYTRLGHDVSAYPFEGREGVLLHLGKMGEYLKGNQQERQPSSVQEYEYAKGDPNFARFLEDRRGPIVANNGDGTFTIIPRGMGGQQQGQPAPPPPGFVIDGGPAGQQPGGFPGGF